MQEEFYIPPSRTHLNLEIHKKARPIYVPVGTPEDYEKSGINLKKPLESFELGDNAQKIEWRGAPAFSKVDGTNKYSVGLGPCIVLVVAGVDRETGENISFLSHQNPGALQSDNFSNTLRQLLKEMKEKCIAGSIDAVLVGGRNVAKDKKEYNYATSIKLLGKEVFDVLEFQPTVANGPKSVQYSTGDHVYYDNEKRALHLIRPRTLDDTGVNRNTVDFPASDVEKQTEKW